MAKGLDQRGVEPLAMKLFAGIVLLVIGLGIGYVVLTSAERWTNVMLSFNVILSPKNATVSSGSTITVNVKVEKSIMGYDKNVSLSASGVPENVTVIFSPPTGVPAFGSTMTIIVGSSAQPGTTTITVKATGTDGVQQTATFDLTVE